MTAESVNVSEVTADILCEFLEVAIHSILYVRELYPLGSFRRKKTYNVPVQVCMHSDVNEYIQQLLQSLKVYVQCGGVDKVMVAVVNSAGRPLERFVFEIAKPRKALKEDTYLLRLEQALRSFLLKLSVCDSMLSNIPEGCSWRVQVSVKESDILAMQEKQLIQDFMWITADAQETNLQEPKILPLKTMDSSVLQMQLYVEEANEKQ